MKSTFLKDYWAYRKDGGRMSMAEYADSIKRLDAESRFMSREAYEKSVKPFRNLTG